MGLTLSATVDTPSGPSIVVSAFVLFLAASAVTGLRREA
jgi:ABC-type Mn2+/Zn2+ transport system permease subunit